MRVARLCSRSIVLTAFLASSLPWTVACQSTAGGGGGEADLVVRDVVVWRGTAGPAASSIAVKGDTIVAVGDTATTAPFVGPRTRVISLPGAFAMPGLHDGHVHPLGAGRQNAGCSLQGIATVAGLLEQVKACDARTRDAAKPDRGGFVTGRGFDLSLFPGANPHKSVLDGVVADRPVYFRGEDGHTGWANSLALAQAGITKDTKDPPHGVIERDPDGAPSGALREDAIELIEKLLPQPTLADDVQALRWAVAELGRLGITSIMDAGVDERRLEAYAALAKEGALPLDVVACVVVDPAEPRKALSEAKGRRARFAGFERLRVTATKIYLDGVLEGETAALLAPYLNHKDPHHMGSINATQAQLNETVTLLEAEGFQVHMHVIGDAAVRAALDAYQASRAHNGDLDRRGTLAHLQLVADADLPRFAALGISANAQSLWAYPDTYIVDINTPQVGQARVDRMYPWGALARAGARVVGGSDWPVSSANPLDAIEVMVTRKDPRKPTDKALGRSAGRDEALSRDQALRAYTTEGAHLLHHEGTRGAVAVGMRADLTVLDRDLLAVPEPELNEAVVVLTIKDGVVVYDSAARASAVAARGAP